jgi:hypothetical protein
MPRPAAIFWANLPPCSLEVTEGVFAFPMLSDAFCELLLEENDNYQAPVGLGRTVNLHCRSSISYQIRSHIRYLYF